MVCLTKLPSRLFGDINFFWSNCFLFCFSSLFSRPLRWRLWKKRNISVLRFVISQNERELNFFSTKKALLLSVSSQLSRLSRFLNVLENWTRQYFITYSLKIWFILTRSKQNWPLKWKNKSLLFLPSSACVASVSVWFRSKEIPRKGTFDFDRALLLAPLFSRSLTLVWLSPRSFLLNRTETLATQAKAIGSGLLSYDDTCMTEECREKHLALIIRHKIRRA